MAALFLLPVLYRLAASWYRTGKKKSKKPPFQPATNRQKTGLTSSGVFNDRATAAPVCLKIPAFFEIGNFREWVQ